MHEMSIAQNIVRLAGKAAQEAGASRISQIEIQIGELAGVMIEALEFSLSVAVRGTLAEHAQLNVDITPGKAVCVDCGATFQTSRRWNICPVCESVRHTILSGEELKIKTIQIETYGEGVSHV